MSGPRGPRKRLLRDTRGATIVEFAIVVPVMVTMIMGLGDVLYQAYAQSLLTGALQKAGRDSAIQGGSDAINTLDQRVIAMVSSIMKNPTKACPAAGVAQTWCSNRKNYDNFTEVAPEPFTDTNGNGVRDAGECYTDQNANGTWDADPGAAGQGGANAVTLYTITLSYARVFPVAGLFGWSNTQTISATTLLRNQPYAKQAVTAAVTKCT